MGEGRGGEREEREGEREGRGGEGSRRGGEREGRGRKEGRSADGIEKAIRCKQLECSKWHF